MLTELFSPTTPTFQLSYITLYTLLYIEGELPYHSSMLDRKEERVVSKEELLLLLSGEIKNKLLLVLSSC